ncbi:hypothetical protein M407DRAFT_245507 [Tulasnella calospora MUT 4182]|uniref:Uncharacterized protein n=1 Tax=Tulasnella calospora MUT 4182 TaxID=1051891 RepID=A0A0C3LJ14_9AGAM|nr:hypothetical protein M407DRAFT_245507 [Tulasnella calospora MUT 4182]
MAPRVFLEIELICCANGKDAERSSSSPPSQRTNESWQSGSLGFPIAYQTPLHSPLPPESPPIDAGVANPFFCSAGRGKIQGGCCDSRTRTRARHLNFKVRRSPDSRLIESRAYN